MTYEEELRQIIHRRARTDHKGCFGHGLLMAGSREMCGCAILGARAALRSGIGLLDLLVPSDSYQCVQSAVPEAMVRRAAGQSAFLESLAQVDFQTFQAVAVGPGIGQHEETAVLLQQLFVASENRRLVLDADALNLTATHPQLMAHLPKAAVLTPHPGEFQRLWQAEHPHDRTKTERQTQVERARIFAQEHGVYLILKGSSTAIASPEGQICLNPTGNPGMATGGSGDVLTGILLSLLSQSYPVWDACRLGVWLHGMAGDLAVLDTQSVESLVAGDLIDFFGQAFKRLSADPSY